MKLLAVLTVLGLICLIQSRNVRTGNKGKVVTRERREVQEEEGYREEWEADRSYREEQYDETEREYEVEPDANEREEYLEPDANESEEYLEPVEDEELLEEEQQMENGRQFNRAAMAANPPDMEEEEMAADGEEELMDEEEEDEEEDDEVYTRNLGDTSVMGEEEKEVEVASRMVSWWGKVPGTRWCGGNGHSRWDKILGRYNRTDACCKDLRGCEHQIPRRATKWGLRNRTWFTVYHCDCDKKFRECLRAPGKKQSNTVRRIYFSFKRCFTVTDGKASWGRVKG